MMKRVLALILALACLCSLAACSSEEEVVLDSTRTTVDKWLLEEVAVQVNEFLALYADAAKEQNCTNYLNTATAGFSATTLSTFGYVLDNASPSDISNKYTYTATAYDQEYSLYYDGTTRNIALEVESNPDGENESIELLEVKELSDGRLALQHYASTVDGRYNLAQMLFSGKNGSVSYSYDLSVRPTRLYTAENGAEHGFATEGDDVFTMNEGTLTYTTARTTLSDVSSMVSWYEGFESNVWDYYNANSDKASEIDRAESYNDYMLAFTNRTIADDITFAMQNGEYMSGMYVATEGDKRVILSFDGKTANISMRVTNGLGDDADNYAFELRETGKRQFAMHYYTLTESGTYTAYRMVLRAEGDSRVGRATELAVKPTLTYSQTDISTSYDWAALDVDFYFDVIAGEMDFIDVEQLREELMQSGTIEDDEYIASMLGETDIA